MKIITEAKNIIETSILEAAIHHCMDCHKTPDCEAGLEMGKIVVYSYFGKLSYEMRNKLIQKFHRFDKGIFFHKIGSNGSNIELIKDLSFGEIDSAFFVGDSTNVGCFEEFKSFFSILMRQNNPNGCFNFQCNICSFRFRGFRKVGLQICRMCHTRNVSFLGSV